MKVTESKVLAISYRRTSGAWLVACVVGCGRAVTPDSPDLNAVADTGCGQLVADVISPNDQHSEDAVVDSVQHDQVADVLGGDGGSASGTCMRGLVPLNCKELDLCKTFGLCTQLPSPACSCVAATDKDCEGSGVCLFDSRCQASGGQCVRKSDVGCGYIWGNSANYSCHFSGSCEPVGGLCGIGSDAGCLASQACAALGQCHACGPRGNCPIVNGAPQLMCYAMNDDDCKRSGVCSWLGGCKHDGSAVPSPNVVACVPGSAADCAQSRMCESMGQCGFAQGPSGAGCVTTQEGCTKSLGCQESGRCQLVKHAELGYPVCEPTSSADCKFSQGCKLWGNCTFDLKTRACAP